MAQAYDCGLQRSLTTRVSNVAAGQLAQISETMVQHTLTEGKDRRRSMMLKKNGELDSSLLYNARKTAHSNPDAWAKFIWHNKAPPRVKFFAWLLSQGRIQCKTVLRKKGVVDNTICEVCQATEQTPAHIIFGCNYARQFWGAIRIQTEADWLIQAIKELQPPNHIPAKYFTTFLLLCCWHI